MSYRNILEKPNAKVLITGDSLAYNRYSYDTQFRTNAYNCGVGMGSWSFALRDKIYSLDTQLTYASDLEFNCKTVSGIDNNSSVPHTAAFSGRVATLYPEKQVEFNVNIKSETMVLYLQTRIDNPCTFDIYVDGSLKKQGVNTQGDEEYFAGYALLPIVVECDPTLNAHTVCFANIKGENPKITVAAVGAKYIDITLNGKGSQTTRFFIDNFEERIGRFTPDLIIISLVGNDRALTSAETMRKDLLMLFALIYNNNKDCKILFLLPPYSHFPSRPDMTSTPYTSIATSDVYNKVVYDVVENMGKDWYKQEGLTPTAKPDVEILAICDLFDKDDTASWRFDNIHLNQHGNQVLLKAVCNKLGI